MPYNIVKPISIASLFFLLCSSCCNNDCSHSVYPDVQFFVDRIKDSNYLELHEDIIHNGAVVGRRYLSPRRDISVYVDLLSPFGCSISWDCHGNVQHYEAWANAHGYFFRQTIEYGGLGSGLPVSLTNFVYEFGSDLGKKHGVQVLFDHNTDVMQERWYLFDKEVDKEQFIEFGLIPEFPLPTFEVNLKNISLAEILSVDLDTFKAE